MYAKQELTTDNVKRTTLKKIYTAEIGVQEATGHNDGPRVQQYLGYVNKKGNFSYCAAFVCWAMGKAGVNNPKNGWAPALFPQNRLIWKQRWGAVKELTTYNLLRTTPIKGDVFGIYFSELKRIAHCGFVDHWDDTWCITVEANTTNPIRAGPLTEGVYRKKRPVKTIYQVANWVDPPGSQPTLNK
ncbi:hypothetical protein SAMN05216436_110112 [bacterium A37T11]|nr:hypothetical protein SAMN05216436_110112 [bacterium A37T11]